MKDPDIQIRGRRIIVSRHNTRRDSLSNAISSTVLPTIYLCAHICTMITADWLCSAQRHLVLCRINSEHPNIFPGATLKPWTATAAPFAFRNRIFGRDTQRPQALWQSKCDTAQSHISPPLSLSVCLSITVSPSIYLCLSIYLSLSLPLYISVSVCLSLSLFVSLSISRCLSSFFLYKP